MGWKIRSSRAVLRSHQVNEKNKIHSSHSTGCGHLFVSNFSVDGVFIASLIVGIKLVLGCQTRVFDTKRS